MSTYNQIINFFNDWSNTISPVWGFFLFYIKSDQQHRGIKKLLYLCRLLWFQLSHSVTFHIGEDVFELADVSVSAY